ncbi:hypothetical protein C1J03_19565 [Sulfitobacter sp. SK012]|nr:hypothetical protein C1J03_19565 [Sulfitobacter sp. SK012]
MPRGIYSGGRYLSLMLAYSMARAGGDVTYVTNNEPLFQGDFDPYVTQHPITNLVTPTFELPEEMHSDWVIVIPTGAFNAEFYDAALSHARACGARVALLSFETPNWYADLSPFPRSPMPTESWRQVVDSGGLVVTIADEGVEYARSYFGAGPEDAPRSFGHWHPSINDLVADAVAPATSRDSVTMFVRTEDPHKGAQDIFAIAPETLEGSVLSLVFGRGVNHDYVAALRRHYSHVPNFAIEVLEQITDVEKFQLLARSKLLLFPSYFEGYGYPPVEAAWMGVPTVAYDLPLLKEVAGDAVRSVPLGDTAAFAEAVKDVLAEGHVGEPVRAMMRQSPDTLTAGQKMLGLMNAARRNVPPLLLEQPGFPGKPADRISEPRYAPQRRELHLLDARATLHGTTVKLNGAIIGAEPGDTIVFGAPGLILAPVHLTGDATAEQFTTSGTLSRWDADATHIDISVHHETLGGTQISLGSLELALDWPLLLSKRGAVARDALQFRVERDVLVLVDASNLVQDVALCSALSEACAQIEAQGRSSHLLLISSKIPPLSDLLSIDLLPRFDTATFVSSHLGAALTAAFCNEGGLMICDNGSSPDGLEIVSLESENGQGQDLVFAGGRLRKSDTKSYATDVQKWGRSAISHAGKAVIVLLPDTPMQGLDDAVSRLLKQIETGLNELRVLVPKSMWQAGPNVPAGHAGTIQAVSDADLAAALHAAPASLGLWLDAPECSDPQTQAILHAFSVPVIEAVDATADAILGQNPLRGNSPLAKTLKSALPKGGTVDPLAHLSAARVSNVIAPATSGQTVALGDVLSLASSAPIAGGTLLHGWGARSIFGAIMQDTEASVTFHLPAGTPPGSGLEIMLHNPQEYALPHSLRVILNDSQITLIENLAAGASIHRIETPPEVWTPSDQTLLLVQEPPHLNGAHERENQNYALFTGVAPRGDHTAEPQKPAIALMAISPMRAPVQPFDFKRTSSKIRSLAPLHLAQPNASSSVGHAGFGTQADAGFARLVAGWARAEPSLVWNNGPEAIMQFTPKLPHDTAVRLNFETHSIAPNAETDQFKGQRVRMYVGDELLAEAAMDNGNSRRFSIVVPHELAALGVDYLRFEFPDAMRPIALGLSGDIRQIAVAFKGVTTTTLPNRISHAALPAPRDATWPLVHVTVDAADGMLRLLGKGSMPSHMRFAILGSTVFAAPLPNGADGWQVCLPLSKDMAMWQRAQVICLVPPGTEGTTPDACEIWTNAGSSPDGNVPTQPLALTFVQGLRAADDARRWRQQLPQCEDLEDNQNRLPLPATFIFDDSGKTEALLAGGWSKPGPTGVWSLGKTADLALPAPIGASILNLEAGTFVHGKHPRQRFVIHLGAQRLATVVLRSIPLQRVFLAVPPESPPGRVIHIRQDDAQIPSEIGASADTRPLGLRMRQLGVTDLESILGGFDLSIKVRNIAVTAKADVDDAHMLLCIQGPGAAPGGVAAAWSEEIRVIVHPVSTKDGWYALLVVPQTALSKGFVGVDILQGSPDEVDDAKPQWHELPLPAKKIGQKR